jgi:hypothetical protein
LFVVLGVALAPLVLLLVLLMILSCRELSNEGGEEDVNECYKMKKRMNGGGGLLFIEKRRSKGGCMVSLRWV